MMVVMANEIVEDLKKQNISVELIDLRTLNPLDMDTVITSLKKTGKLLVVHEACKTGGFGAELSARITEEAFHYLDAPVLRLGAKDCPVPYCKDLEDAVLPQKEDIRQKIVELASY
jgi:pyruvate/2-oxoglutarate/acetoin dehydrogenase E1 component